MTRRSLFRNLVVHLLLTATCNGLISQRAGFSPGKSTCCSFDRTSAFAPPSATTSCGSTLFGSSKSLGEQSSHLHLSRRAVLLRALQKWRRITVLRRGKMLRSVFAWCRKQYLSTVVALALAFACLFGPLLASPAHATDTNGGMMTNRVLVSKVSALPHSTGESSHQAVCTVDSREAAVMEGEQSDVEGGSETLSTKQSGGAMRQSEEKDAATHAVAGASSVKRKSKSAGKRAAGVVVATAAGGGAFAMTKRKIKRDENTLDDKMGATSAMSEPIEKKPKVVPPVQTRSQSLPLCDPVHLKARQQPKAPVEESELATKYAQIGDVGERAFQILIDLGMIELHG